jgi:GNAT acetyltransferase-like protein
MHEPAAQNEVIPEAVPLRIAAEEPESGVQENNHKIPSRFNPLAPTIFHEEWWLDAATGGRFEVAEVRADGRIVGSFPFHKTKRFGLTTIRTPELTYFLGPAIDEGQGSPNTRFLKRLQITRELIERLPRASWQYVKCHRRVTDVIAFQEAGFRTYVQFTHEIEPRPVAILWKQMRNKTRNVIRRAQERFAVSEWADPFAFLRFYKCNLERKKQIRELDMSLCGKIIAASLARQRGRILAAHDNHGRIVAANFCAWDETSAFYLLSARGLGSCNSATSLLLWEAVKQAARRDLTFDFAGLGNTGSILVYSGFTARISSRYVAVRARRLARVMNELKSLFAPENCFY